MASLKFVGRQMSQESVDLPFSSSSSPSFSHSAFDLLVDEVTIQIFQAT